MMDYSTLSDDELNRLIAERRGWRIIRHPQSDIDEDGQQYPPYLGWEVLDFEGQSLGLMLAFEDPGPWKNFHYFIPQARVANDLNATLELLKDMGFAGVHYDKTAQTFEAYGPGAAYILRVRNDRPSRAVSEVFCMVTDEVPTPAMLAAKAEDE